MEKFYEFEYPSKGAGMIHAYQWNPEGAPKGIVQIVHGIAEHCLRYAHVAKVLNEEGYIVVAEDHMGHGKSHGSGAALYYEGGWKAAVADTHELTRRKKEEYPGLPYYLYGHSMGSFMTRSILCLYPEDALAGAIICGTGWQSGVMMFGGKAVLGLEKLLHGAKAPAKLFHKIAFGGYNKSFGTPRTDCDWLNTDPAEVDQYIADPLCGGTESVGLARAMMDGLTLIEKKSSLEKMNKDLPVLFIAGKEDPVGTMGKGVEQSRKAFAEAGMKDVSMQLFDGRHEIHNEPNREEVFRTVIAFLNKNLPA